MKTQTRTATLKAKKKPISLTFAKLERMARKQGVPVFIILDAIINQCLNQ